MAASKADEARSGGQRGKKRLAAAARVKTLVEKAWAYADVNGVSEREALKFAKRARNAEGVKKLSPHKFMLALRESK